MSIRIPPQELSEWNIDILNEFINIPTVENEMFDFKAGDNYDFNKGEIEKAICAMANTSGGILFLGIGEMKAGDRVLRFRKPPI